MEMDSLSSSSIPTAPLDCDPNPTVENRSPSSRTLINRNKNKKKKKAIDREARSSSYCSVYCLSSTQRGWRVKFRRRVRVGPVWRNKGGEVESVGLHVGMSFAAVVAQVLEKKDGTNERLSSDYLSVICTSAVRESLTNVFGDKFDCFVRNFEKSFGSTLRTLRLINESSRNKGRNSDLSNPDNVDRSTSDEISNSRKCYKSTFQIKESYLEAELPCSATQNQFSGHEEVPENNLPEQFSGHEEVQENNLTEQFSVHEEVQENNLTDSLNRELAFPEQISACVTSNTVSVVNKSMLERSVVEQVRSNELKAIELGLSLKKLKLKEAQLALNVDSNHLERSKLAMGISKASFKAEKFKNQLEDTRHAELLKKCIDCLVAGLLTMSFFLIYGAYVYSYKRISDATLSCNPQLEESKSWWIPKPMASFNSGLHTLRCQFQILSRMMFGILMILAVAFLLIQRSGTTKHTMPVTFILLLLGIGCGLAGKVCVDTLGGNGYYWLIYWEILCCLHFLANICTSMLFFVLHGPVNVLPEMRESTLFPYWVRRSLFYSSLLLILPLLCGLVPFASLGEWKDHFFQLILDDNGEL